VELAEKTKSPPRADSLFTLSCALEPVRRDWTTFITFSSASPHYSTTGRTSLQRCYLLAPRTTMKSNALLLLAVCLFAAFAAAWTKEGTYYTIRRIPADALS
jgi:hypothetical protein